MEGVNGGTSHDLAADPLPFARSYQLEALEKAIKQNTIAYLETGSGKTLIAIMLLRTYAYLIRKPSRFLAVFLVPTVVLVKQQAEAVGMHTDLKVGTYWGEMGVDYWSAQIWEKQIQQHEVLVMTPQILLNGLRHSFFKLDMIKVLILDECHHAKGQHPYACIMTEFYHRKLSSGSCDLPRIFGMTASPIKSKGAKSEENYWKQIHDLETIMCSKVYTCSETVLAEFIPFSTPKFRFYKHFQYAIHEGLVAKLKILKSEQEYSLKNLDLSNSVAESTMKKLEKRHSTLVYCLDDLGVLAAFKAAQVLASCESDFFSWDKLNKFGETIAKNFSHNASLAFQSYIRTGSEWPSTYDAKADSKAGLLTTKVVCLIESLLEYRHLKDIRCIVFVERVIAAVAIQSLLGELLPKFSNWKTEYIAGNNSRLQNQTRKTQNEIVQQFRKGAVNIIVATSILEEGLDVQSCNLVIRFDPSVTVSSFIQSRGRARMQDSDYILMLKSGDFSTQSRLENYLISRDIMKRESLRHASLPCSPLHSEFFDDELYSVESTDAIVNFSSSVQLLYFYCSRLPSDGYYKPSPRCIVDKEMKTCTLILPKNCSIPTIFVHGDIKTLKQKACLEACKQLHKIGALNDNLVPDIFAEEAATQEVGNEAYDDEQALYFPPELVSKGPEVSKNSYFCYLIQINSTFDYSIPVHNIILVTSCKLEAEIINMDLDLEVGRGLLTVNFKDLGEIDLNTETASMCRKFQITLLEILMENSLDKLDKILGVQSRDLSEIDYFLLPSTSHGPTVDWDSVASILFSYSNVWQDHVNCPLKQNARIVQTKNGPVCQCVLQNSLVFTPHNGKFYCITGVFADLNGNSLLRLRNGRGITYKKYYEKYDMRLQYDQELLLKGRHIFPLQNYIQRCRQEKVKDVESKDACVELPPELCCIVMSPISISTLYSFSFVPSIMYRLESLLLANNLKKMHLDHFNQNVVIPTIKVLEAITTKKCQEKFHLESLETLGDSFLKYAACQQLFKNYQNSHEGLLSVKKDKIISNAALCKLGCNSKLPGFIRNESFEPKNWNIPGDRSRSYTLEEQFFSNDRKIYVIGKRKVKGKTVADVVEALIGAYVSCVDEVAGLLFMDWIGIKVDFLNTPYQRHFPVQADKLDKLLNVCEIESILKYSFRDSSLLVEALTHGSYMVPEIPRCYQRLEFLGDSVLDFLITMHLHSKYPGMSPGLLTDMRSASVNNDCYALSAIKEGLHKHILHASQDLHKHINVAVKDVEEFSSDSIFGWESEISLPKVLGDVIESLAGAIFVDSGYNKEVVFKSIRPLLEPLITPETIRYHPVRELHELCQKHHFDQTKPTVSRNNNTVSFTVEVVANGATFRNTATAPDKKTAERIASREVLKALKKTLSGNGASEAKRHKLG